MKKKILLLGSGELGKEFALAAQRLGQWVAAADRYADAPAMQVAHAAYVLDMLDGDALDRLVAELRPDIIVPEIEAIRTERLYQYEAAGVQVVPSAKAVNFTMNRRAIRDLAAEKLGLRTAKFEYATSLPELKEAVGRIGLPCVVKPLMSSSGKGQSVLRSAADIASAWEAAAKGRGDFLEVIVEEFIPFLSEITLLTVTQQHGQTLFCAPIGHRQARGDYQESWQPHPMPEAALAEAREMARRITAELGGAGLWGVEFFLTEHGVVFSELSPRPHDTGMVTLAGTQDLNQFELHLRAILGLPIGEEIPLRRCGASSVVLADRDIDSPVCTGLEQALGVPQTEVRVFGKPVAHPFRRMAVALAWGEDINDPMASRARANEAAAHIRVV
jgi:phosphoribosylglycinamide formyltransferase 2